ncbi:hypothetical protein [Duganella sp.]|uniref:hypothetical protein n=1 Tax=Duganella sp. TaxID=1904440 RepID=UPI0031D00CAA
MDDKQIHKDLIMHFGYSLLYVMVVAAGAVIVELFARGMRWFGVSDFSYYILSGTAHLLLVMDAVLLVAVCYYAARKLWRRAAYEKN